MRSNAVNLRVRARPPRRFFTATWGLVVGAICGFITYWAGAFVVSIPALLRLQPSPAELQVILQRPLEIFTAWEFVSILAGAIVGLAAAQSRWRLSAVFSFVALLCIIGGYLAYSLTVSLPKVPAGERGLSWTLLAFEAAGLTLMVIFTFYSLDATGRRRWIRQSSLRPWDLRDPPHVALLVPTYNEPPEMVKQTILHLLRQDYPANRLKVLVLDDSTDPSTRRALQEFCESVQVQYIARPNRNGYKAGALNYALAQLSPEYTLFAVIDADYWVEPTFAREAAGYFVDPSLAFVQTPQSYRNGAESFLARAYQLAERYFYGAIMPTRNEENTNIFCGTMGMLRRAAVDAVGGFAEDQICEDAEISVRLSAAGWSSLYVGEPHGRGLLPSVFDAYKKQFHRWAFGNVRIFFTHARLILRSPMRARQKFHFLVSNLHWFDGLFVLGISASLLYLGLAPMFGFEATTHHQYEFWMVGFVPLMLLVDGVGGLRLVLHGGGRVGFRETLLVIGLWFSIKMTNLRAALKAALGFHAPFVRTPKTPPGRTSRSRALALALRLAPFETLIGGALIASAVVFAQRNLVTHPASALLAVWMVIYAVLFLCAPLYAYMSYRTLRRLDFRLLEFEPVPDRPGFLVDPRASQGANVVPKN
jgi:cellulose synthase/poly-beta-1,6-N-acetylglucosamine synthase-like glycosyltransferase